MVGTNAVIIIGQRSSSTVESLTHAAKLGVKLSVLKDFIEKNAYDNILPCKVILLSFTTQTFPNLQ